MLNIYNAGYKYIVFTTGEFPINLHKQITQAAVWNESCRAGLDQKIFHFSLLKSSLSS